MPKVPVQQLQEVAPRPLPQQRLSSAGATPDAFGAALGRALEGPVAQGFGIVAHETHKIALDNIERDRTRKLLDLNTAWQAAKREKLYGTPDNPNGLFTKKGATALEQAPVTDQELEDLRQGFLKNVDDEHVALAFEKSSGADMEESRGQMARYVTGERETAEKTTRLAVFNEARQAIAADPANDMVVRQSIFLAEQSALEQAEADGFKATDVAALSAVEAARSAVLKDGIESLARTDGMAAMALFKAYEGKIDGDTRSDLVKTLETATIAEYAQGVTDHIMSIYGSDQAGALAHARETLSGDREDEVIKRINAQFNEIWSQGTREHLTEQRALTRAQTVAAQGEAAYTTEYRAADRDLTLAINEGQSVDEWAAEHPLEWSTLKTNDTKKFYELESEYGKRQNFAPVSDPETLAAITKMTPDERAAINLEDYQGKLSYKDFNALEKRRASDQALVDRRNAAAVRQLEHEQAQVRLAETQADKDARKEAMVAVQEGVPLEQWMRDNPEKARAIKEESLAPLRAAETAYVNGKEYAPVTDGKTEASIRGMSTVERAQLDINEYKAMLTEEEFRRADSLINSAKTKVENGNNKLYPSMRQAVERYAPKSYGFDKAAPSDDQKRKQQWVLDEIDSWVADQINSGNTPKPGDIEKAAQDLMVRAIKPDTTAWYQSSNEQDLTVRQALKTLTPEQKAQVIVRKENIPPYRLNKILDLIRSNGFEETDELIEEFAGARYMNDDARAQAIYDREMAKKKGTQ